MFDISCKLSPSNGDNFQEMPKPVFWNKKENIINLSSAELPQRVEKVMIKHGIDLSAEIRY